ncbi:ATP-grasp domain-containing protein [Micromonospora sp. PLK6-60]|uniref:ATP-grasp domain-containing protein n=1 Tax=Micromonospora sp. PLK6-60 TaxID=2873383 RepID=UPI001CA7B224|nr:ATP-grasp domain-containing protein [Micromonospora sp. PLK6-60]MBY8870649.1 ATP-grasp domain-containing protein [Micromonospora sp. PLK6-60]
MREGSLATHLLIVGGGRETPALARAAAPGLRTSVFCRAEVLPRVRDVGRNARVVVFPDDGPEEEWVAEARAIHARDPFDALATYSEKDQDKLAAIGAALGLPAHRPETVRWVHDKVAMRERLAATGVDDTRAIRVRDLAEASAAADTLGFPLVCKPVRGVGSCGVSRVDGPRDLAVALAFLDRQAGELDSAEALLEPLHEGREYSVECLSENGVHLRACITAKVTEPRHFGELGHTLPARLDAADEASIDKTVHAVLDALGVRDGVTHTEVILTDAGVRVVETHLRPAGDEIPYLLRRVRDVDLVDALARQSVGLRVLDEVRERLVAAPDDRYAAIWYGVTGAVGQVVEVAGADEARARDGVVDVEVLCEPGDELARPDGPPVRTVGVQAVGASPEEALDRARAAAALVSVVLRTPAVPAA